MFPTALLALSLAAATAVDGLWAQFRACGEPELRAGIWRQLQADGWPDDFDATLSRLRHRDYHADVPTGLLRRFRLDRDGRRYPYKLLVPTSYDPAHAYPVRVVLHGSTRRPAWREDQDHFRWSDSFQNETSITIFPAAWMGARWWTHLQVENLRAILDETRALYHLDSNRSYLAGISDGGTGAFYHALRAPTPWTPAIRSPIG